MSLSRRDREEFRAFCAQATDRQLPNIYAKEMKAARDNSDEDREEYAQIAKEVMEERGLSFGSSSAERQTMHEFVRRHVTNFKCVRTDRNPAMEDAGGRSGMDHWRCTIFAPGGKRATITFSMGSGHHGAEPTAADVLNAMASDCSSVRNSNGWEDFAREMGMETEEEDRNTGRMKPNRRAKRIYAACEKECEKLVNLFGDPDIVEELMYQTEGL